MGSDPSGKRTEKLSPSAQGAGTNRQSAKDVKFVLEMDWAWSVCPSSVCARPREALQAANPSSKAAQEWKSDWIMDGCKGFIDAD